jgi:hypothetical protein
MGSLARRQTICMNNNNNNKKDWPLFHPQEDSWSSFLLEDESKIPMTSLGIEPATFRCVA